MAEFTVNPWGFVLALDHGETHEALTVADTLKERIPHAIEQAIALGLISAAVFNPVTVGVVVTAIVGYVTVQKELIRASDQGYGVYLTVPHAAIFIAIQGGVIALALIIPGTRPAPQPQPTPPPHPGHPTRGIGDHLYTTNAQEREAARTTRGYVTEGIACYVFEGPVTGTARRRPACARLAERPRRADAARGTRRSLTAPPVALLASPDPTVAPPASAPTYHKNG